jgi:hypothetical protein
MAENLTTYSMKKMTTFQQEEAKKMSYVKKKLFSRKLVATAKSQVLNLFHIIVKKLILHVK